MSLLIIIYLASILSNVQVLALILVITLGIFGVIAGLIFLICLLDRGHEDITETLGNIPKYIKTSVVIFFISLFSLIFIPSKTEMYVMFAVDQIDTSKLSDTAKKGVEVLNIKLDEIISESKK